MRTNGPARGMVIGSREMYLLHQITPVCYNYCCCVGITHSLCCMYVRYVTLLRYRTALRSKDKTKKCRARSRRAPNKKKDGSKRRMYFVCMQHLEYWDAVIARPFKNSYY